MLYCCILSGKCCYYSVLFCGFSSGFLMKVFKRKHERILRLVAYALRCVYIEDS